MLALYDNLTAHYFGIQRYMPDVHKAYTRKNKEQRQDAAANRRSILTSDGSQGYTYDQAKRLVGVTGAGLTWSAAYNGDSARARQTTHNTDRITCAAFSPDGKLLGFRIKGGHDPAVGHSGEVRQEHTILPMTRLHLE